ncbi:uncharacterized protein LOC101783930 [Setaria italica]|uniref:Uncharacterized protein n=2 Tax=Setaria italica TaxID=4555 RepID=K4ACU0_SETIT|nr:uncharacterized protein LOC101783930 [Setaria italica]
MAFMAKHKEVAAETSEALEQQFRPIVPRPMAPSPPPLPIGATVRSIQWKAQKRSRQDYSVPSPVSKRERDAMSYPSPPVLWATVDVEAPMLLGGRCMPEIYLPSCEENLRRLSLVGSSASSWAPSLDAEQIFSVEHDLISKLQVPKVIKPRPTRPKRTTIRIERSNIIDSTNLLVEVVVSKKTPREVEAELALPNALPAIVSGCNSNRVHLTNDAYKEMVGQPLCPWLNSLLGAGAPRRINGEVVLYVQTFSTVSCLQSTWCAFPCTARISWEDEDATVFLTVPCAIERVTGNSDDYCFIWRFDCKRKSIMYSIA